MFKKIAVVGTGGRVGGMFLFPLAEKYAEGNKIVAFCDLSMVRMKYYQNKLRDDYAVNYPIQTFHASEFDRMIAESQPDEVIVCTIDSAHCEFIVQSLDAGCDVIVEKPLAVSSEQLCRIHEAVKRSGKRVRVAFNYRWTPAMTKVWEILRSGELGKVQHVNLEYLLDTKHGADYFRRWHSKMENSGGLLVHKATHHFDLVNWWIDSIPEEVSAHGRLAFYGKGNAIERGDGELTKYERYLDSPVDDPFRINLLADGKNPLYVDAEEETGYIRDRNVFRDDIDIFDTMSLTARYRNDVLFTYSLVAYSPREGFKLCLTCDRGRLELIERHSSHLIMGQSDAELAAEQSTPQEEEKGFGLTVQKHFRPPVKVPIEQKPGGHWGADPQLQEQFFSKSPAVDHAKRLAGHEQGAASAALGLAANRSIMEKRIVTINEIFPFNENIKTLSELF